MKKLFAAVVAVAALCTATIAHTATLEIGSPAPQLKVSKWVKGQPITKFEKGKIYVVEFWATWCGPCKTSIPHLTELAKEYKGKVTFAGINVWDAQKDDTQDAYIKKIAKFVNEQGDKMSYKVGLDDLKGTMAETWMTASGSNGIPTAFVVGKDGKIDMICHPMELDDCLKHVVAGTWDPKAAADNRKNEQAEQEKFQQLMTKVDELAKNGQEKEAVAEIDKFLAEYPQAEESVVGAKFQLLMKCDEPAAIAYAVKLSDGMFKTNGNALAWFAERLMESKSPDYNTAAAIAQKAVDASGAEPNPSALTALAEATFGKGDTAKAAELQTQAITAAGDKIPENYKKMLEDRLAKYKGGAEKPAE